MKSNLAALAAGALFSLGLCISGMASPAKVQGFLDVTGRWDASLAFVMIGAIGVHAIAVRLISRRKAPLFMPGFQPRPVKVVDRQLLAGAAIFGLGWGLAGYCPGPSFVAAGGLQLNGLVFIATMSLGMLVHRALHERTRAAAGTSPA